MKPLRTALFLLAGLLPLRAFADDIVTLKNGDRLSGKVVQLAGGKLTIKTAHSGDVLVDWAQIVGITTEEAVKVKLSSGELLDGKLSPGEAGKLRIESATVGKAVEIDPAQIAKINETPTEWHGFIEVGARATGGNTRSQGVYAAAELLRETEIDRFLIKANYSYSRSSGVMTARNAYGQVKYDYKFTKNLYAYLSEELFNDYFRDLRIRTVTSLGAGLVIVKEDKIESWVEAGVTYVTNDFYAAKDEGHLGARLYHHFKAVLPLGLEFTNDFTWYPNFRHSTNWQLREEAFLAAGLGKGWTARAGVIVDYDHEVPEERRREDVLYLFTLGYKF